MSLVKKLEEIIKKREFSGEDITIILQKITVNKTLVQKCLTQPETDFKTFTIEEIEKKIKKYKKNIEHHEVQIKKRNNKDHRGKKRLTLINNFNKRIQRREDFIKKIKNNEIKIVDCKCETNKDVENMNLGKTEISNNIAISMNKLEFIMLFYLLNSCLKEKLTFARMLNEKFTNEQRELQEKTDKLNKIFVENDMGRFFDVENEFEYRKNLRLLFVEILDNLIDNIQNYDEDKEYYDNNRVNTFLSNIVLYDVKYFNSIICNGDYNDGVLSLLLDKYKDQLSDQYLEYFNNIENTTKDIINKYKIYDQIKEYNKKLDNIKLLNEFINSENKKIINDFYSKRKLFNIIIYYKNIFDSKLREIFDNNYDKLNTSKDNKNIKNYIEILNLILDDQIELVSEATRNVSILETEKRRIEDYNKQQAEKLATEREKKGIQKDIGKRSKNPVNEKDETNKTKEQLEEELKKLKEVSRVKGTDYKPQYYNPENDPAVQSRKEEKSKTVPEGAVKETKEQYLQRVLARLKKQREQIGGTNNPIADINDLHKAILKLVNTQLEYIEKKIDSYALEDEYKEKKIYFRKIQKIKYFQLIIETIPYFE